MKEYRDIREVNHDWLKNVWLVRISAEVARLDGSVMNSIELDVDLVDISSQFRVRMEEIKFHLDEFVVLNSPRRMVYSYSLKISEPEIKEAIAELVHILWMSKYDINNNITRIGSSIENALMAIEALARVGELSGNTDRVLRGLRVFYEKCAELSSAITELPKEGTL